MNIVDVCRYAYPGQMPDNIGIGIYSDGTYVITKWTVPNVDQPTIEYLESLIPTYEAQYNADTYNSALATAVSNHVEQIALAKSYDSSASCASYVNDLNPVWANEAKAFISWRSEVWVSTIALQDSVSSGTLPTQTVDEFVSSLPTINWGD